MGHVFFPKKIQPARAKGVTKETQAACFGLLRSDLGGFVGAALGACFPGCTDALLADWLLEVGEIRGRFFISKPAPVSEAPWLRLCSGWAGPGVPLSGSPPCLVPGLACPAEPVSSERG